MGALLHPGQLDRFITIETPSYTRNSINEEIVTWAVFAQVYAEKQDIQGREMAEAAQAQVAVITTIFRIWYLDGVRPDMRISLDGSYWNIQDVAELGRREGQELRCLRRQ